MSHSTGKKKISGVDFVVDEAGEKKAVIIDLRRHKALWEDFFDTALAGSGPRSRESRESLASVKRRILGK
ncbi:MAG: hypothetical protein ACSLE5_00700 [Porticoccaceae bacterium]